MFKHKFWLFYKTSTSSWNKQTKIKQVLNELMVHQYGHTKILCTIHYWSVWCCKKEQENTRVVQHIHRVSKNRQRAYFNKLPSWLHLVLFTCMSFHFFLYSAIFFFCYANTYHLEYTCVWFDFEKKILLDLFNVTKNNSAYENDAIYISRCCVYLCIRIYNSTIRKIYAVKLPRWFTFVSKLRTPAVGMRVLSMRKAAISARTRFWKGILILWGDACSICDSSRIIYRYNQYKSKDNKRTKERRFGWWSGVHTLNKAMKDFAMFSSSTAVSISQTTYQCIYKS